MKADQILNNAAQHMKDRAAARDKPEGERSMGRTVMAFNALTGHQLSERDGWLFMVALKMARACNTATGSADDYEDLAAYSALAGESVAPANDNQPDMFLDQPLVPSNRTFNVEGKDYPVPSWARFAAQDHDGAWWFYECKPVAKMRYWSIGTDQNARGELFTAAKRNADWELSLYEFPPRGTA